MEVVLSVLAFALPVIFFACINRMVIKQLLDLNNMTNSLPGRLKLNEWMSEYSVECLIDAGIHMKGKPNFIACDKGNKDGIEHFVKSLCW